METRFDSGIVVHCFYYNFKAFGFLRKIKFESILKGKLFFKVCYFLFELLMSSLKFMLIYEFLAFEIDRSKFMLIVCFEIVELFTCNKDFVDFFCKSLLF